MIRMSFKIVISLAVMMCGQATIAQNQTSNYMIEGKKDLGSLLALYPAPMTVVGAHVQGKVNWLVVCHTGILGHNRVLVSMSKKHYTNQGIIQPGACRLILLDVICSSKQTMWAA